MIYLAEKPTLSCLQKENFSGDIILSSVDRSVEPALTKPICSLLPVTQKWISENR